MVVKPPSLRLCCRRPREPTQTLILIFCHIHHIHPHPMTLPCWPGVTVGTRRAGTGPATLGRGCRCGSASNRLHRSRGLGLPPAWPAGSSVKGWAPKILPVKLSRGDLGGQPHVLSLHLAVCPQHSGLELSSCVETQVCSSARP